MEPFQVVCIDEACAKYRGMPIGTIYTVINVSPFGGDMLYYLREVSGGHSSWRFKTLEEMQNTNFVAIARENQ